MYSLYRAWLSLNHHCYQLPPSTPLHPLNPLIIPDPTTASPTTITTTNNNISTNISPLNLTNHHNQHHQGGTSHVPALSTGTGQTSRAAARGSTNGNSSGAQSQPDVCLQVGTTMTAFSAHRNVLIAQSGYFKAALATHTGSGPIHVPNVNVDEFSSLLTFMYTGYLDLNISNIYNILLATHILHMPRALEICRAYLINQQPPNNQQIDHGTIQLQGNIIKPIASRRQLVVGQINQQVFAPIYSNLEKSESTPFKVVEKGTAKMHKEQMASTSKLTANVETPIEKRSVANSSGGSKKTGSSGSGHSKVIIDIACCDGPVRFHRVVNKNYGQTDVISNVENAPINKNAALNKVMQENINKQRTTTDENAKSTDLFTCLYCNHTFKSQYCYQKHARRHLNPVNIDSTPTTTTTTGIQKVENTRREVRLLDMNVQYYPCKTCGSKFPSYYFVHKHRKMCHAEEMADNENKNNEIVAHNSDGAKGTVDGRVVMVGDDDENISSSGSKNSVIIDVEDVETDSNV